MQNNKKMYVEFFGLPGSGKTTICNALAKKLKEERVDVIFQKKEFMKNSKIYRHTIPILYVFLRLKFHIFKFFLFLFSNFKKWENNDLMIRYYFLHNYFINYFSGNKILLSDQGIINSIDTRELDSKKIKKILEFYPKDREIFFIFLKVSNPEIILKRRIKREESIIKKMTSGQSNFYKKTLNNQTINEKSWDREKICRFLKKEENATIKKVIEIDGEKSIEENVTFLKTQLNENINQQ